MNYRISVKKVVLFTLLAVMSILFACSEQPNNSNVQDESTNNDTTEIKSTKDLIYKMYDRYHKNWYHSIAFQQTTNFYKDDSVIEQQIWNEAYLFPGKLIIKYENDKYNSGMLFRNDSLYVFKDGKIDTAMLRTHDLVVLSLDIFLANPETSLNRIKKAEYNTAIFSENEFNGRRVFVVGAKKGDSLSNQFWIDQETLLFVRMIKQSDRGVEDVIMEDYKQADGGWIEQKVTFFFDQRLYLHEDYFNIQVTALPDSIFYPSKFSTIKW